MRVCLKHHREHRIPHRPAIALYSDTFLHARDNVQFNPSQTYNSARLWSVEKTGCYSAIRKLYNNEEESRVL